MCVCVAGPLLLWTGLNVCGFLPQVRVGSDLQERVCWIPQRVLMVQPGASGSSEPGTPRLLVQGRSDARER